MTNKQIAFILNEIGGYSTDMLIPLTEVNTIALISDENIYPDDSTHVYFDSVNELCVLYDGKTVAGTFIPNKKPRCIISYESIQAFLLTSKYRRKSPYMAGLSM